MDRMVPRVVSLDKCVFSNMTLFLKEQLQNASEKSISSHNCGLFSLPQLNISRQESENKRKALIGHTKKLANQRASLFQY